jgi:hypothetical protein
MIYAGYFFSQVLLFVVSFATVIVLFVNTIGLAVWALTKLILLVVETRPSAFWTYRAVLGFAPCLDNGRRGITRRR